MTNQTEVRSDALNRELLRKAFGLALKSPDTRTQNGCFVAELDGSEALYDLGSCNDLVSGIEATPERVTSPLKDIYVEHAERNLIYRAAREGVLLDGVLLVATWKPCVACARAIVQAGIAELLIPQATYPEHWLEEISAAALLLREAGVLVTEVRGVLGETQPIRRMGEIFLP